MATGENGDDVIIYVGANAIASQRNVTLNSEMSVIETSAKGDAEGHNPARVKGLTPKTCVEVLQHQPTKIDQEIGLLHNVLQICRG